MKKKINKEGVIKKKVESRKKKNFQTNHVGCQIKGDQKTKSKYIYFVVVEFIPVIRFLVF